MSPGNIPLPKCDRVIYTNVSHLLYRPCPMPFCASGPVRHLCNLPSLLRHFVGNDAAETPHPSEDWKRTSGMTPGITANVPQ